MQGRRLKNQLLLLILPSKNIFNIVWIHVSYIKLMRTDAKRPGKERLVMCINCAHITLVCIASSRLPCGQCGRLFASSRLNQQYDLDYLKPWVIKYENSSKNLELKIDVLGEVRSLRETHFRSLSVVKIIFCQNLKRLTCLILAPNLRSV